MKDFYARMLGVLERALLHEARAIERRPAKAREAPAHITLAAGSRRSATTCA
jgi:hypothetical protein